jgi:hypothetical protein
MATQPSGQSGYEITSAPFGYASAAFCVKILTHSIGVFRSMKGLLQEGGILRLYRGILPEMSGMIPKTSAMFYAYEQSKRALTGLGGRWGTPIKAATTKDGKEKPAFEATTLTAFVAVTLLLDPCAVLCC